MDPDDNMNNAGMTRFGIGTYASKARGPRKWISVVRNDGLIWMAETAVASVPARNKIALFWSAASVSESLMEESADDDDDDAMDCDGDTSWAKGS